MIKGNNLTALHTLKKRRDIYGQVKLIYIDPPYNTDNDSFNYNDSFKHSTWLTFMKNRLEIAREFLRDDGVIFIQCDDNEQAYLKVLCDEIFGRENFEVTITCKVKSPSGLGSGVKPFFDCTEFILVYSKNKNQKSRFKILKEDVSVVCEANDRTTNNYNQVLEYFNKENSELVIIDGVKLYRTKDFKIISAEKTQKFYYENYEKIFRLSPSKFSSRLPKDDFIYFNENGGIFYKNNDLAFLKLVSRLDSKSRKIYKQEWQSNLILGNMWQGLQKEGEITLKNGKKPEALIKRIIEISTNENDLVMDFFAGSGTTLAVAHKMKRRWVGVEQMDYIKSITKERLKKVVEGEQGGISKAVGWSGGGSFVYAKLMPLNAVYKERITNSNDERELEKLYKELETKAFVDYRIDIGEMLKDKEFHALDLEEKREILIKILDSNMDYVPYDDIEDESYGVSAELMELNRIFYGESDE